MLGLAHNVGMVLAQQVETGVAVARMRDPVVFYRTPQAHDETTPPRFLSLIRSRDHGLRLPCRFNQQRNGLLWLAFVAII
jgi:hypothetical protein